MLVVVLMYLHLHEEFLFGDVGTNLSIFIICSSNFDPHFMFYTSSLLVKNTSLEDDSSSFTLIPILPMFDLNISTCNSSILYSDLPDSLPLYILYSMYYGINSALYYLTLALLVISI